MATFQIIDPQTNQPVSIESERMPTQEEALEFLNSRPAPASFLEKLPRELTSLPNQPRGSLITGAGTPGVGLDVSISPEERQREMDLEAFAEQFPGRARTAQLGRFALETGGGLLGALPGAPAGPVGAIATGGLGFAGGKELADILEMAIGTPRGRELSQRTPVEGIAELGEDVAMGAALEGLIRGGSPIVRRIFQAGANVPGRVLRLGTSPEAEAVARELSQRGVQVTPAMATGAPLMKGVESTLESFPFSGARLAREFETIESQFAQAQERTLGQLGPKQGDIQFGEKLQGMLEKGNEISQKVVKDAYDAPRQIIGDTIQYEAIETSTAAKDLLASEKQLPDYLRANAVALAKQLSEPKLFNWPSLLDVRARTNELIDLAKSRGDFKEARVIEGLITGVRKDLKEFASDHGALDALNLADAAYVDRQQIFGNPRMLSLLSAEPEAFKRLVARDESAAVISKIRDVVGPQAFEPIKRTFAEKIFASGKPLEEFGDDTLNSVFSPSELTDLKKFIKQAEFLDLQKPTQDVQVAKGVVRRAIGLSPYGAFYFGPGAAAGALVATTIPPAVISRLWLSPQGRRYLLEGSKISANSTAGKAISGTIRTLVAGGAAAASVAEEPSLEEVIQESQSR